MKHQIFEPSCYYHIYNRGNNRETIFKSEENYYYFIKLVKKYLLPITEIYGYCLLPNHFHLIIKIKDEELLPQRIKEGKTSLHQPFSNMFNAYTKAINKRYLRTGSLFQKPLKRIKIEEESYLMNLIVYVNTNTSHHSLADFETYKFSSYQEIISNKFALLEKKVIELFDDKENFIYQHHIKNINIKIKKFLFEVD